jgi:hypothetical protein
VLTLDTRMREGVCNNEETSCACTPPTMPGAAQLRIAMALIELVAWRVISILVCGVYVFNWMPVAVVISSGCGVY